MNNFIESELGSLLDKIIDYRGKTPKKLKGDWALSGIPALSAKNIKQGRIVNHGSIRYVNNDLYSRWMKEEVRKGDILMTSEAPLGETFYVKNNDKLLLSQRLFAIRTKTNKLNSAFLFYYFNSKFGNHELLSRATGTTVGGIRQTALMKVLVRYPQNISIQTSIASVLSSYDDLIENNEKRIKHLEEMAQLLYTEWFVKFNFPGHEKVKMVDSGTDYGMIPEGWEVKTFGNSFYVKYGKTLPTSKISKSGEYKVYGAGGIIGYYDQKNVDAKTTLVTCRGNGSGTVWRTFGVGFITNNSFTVSGKNEEVGFEFIYSCLKGCNIAGSVTGSAQPQITIENINFVKFILPPVNLISAFIIKTRKLYELSDDLLQKNQALSKIRDLLIPQLVTGKRELKV